MIVTVTLCVAGWLAGWWAFGRPRPLGSSAGAPPRDLSTMTVLIPARNESASLGGLLGDLAEVDAESRGPRVVVIDDSSQDDTAAIAREAGVELIEATPLPPGWAGKCWACHTGVGSSLPLGGAEGADDELLVFLDADVRLEPFALGSLVEEHRRSGGLVSVQPWHDTRRPYEQLSALFNVIALMGTGAGSDHATGAFGPVLVTSRADYRTSGGHAAVRGEVVEDLALADAYRGAGLPVTVLSGRGSIRFRMYPDGLRSLIDGWTKNFASGAAATALPRLAAIVVWFTAMGSAALELVDAARGLADVAPAVAMAFAFVVQLVVLFRQVGRFGVLTALAYPVLLVFFVAVFVRSLWRTHVRRSVEWRGRLIETSRRR